MLDVPRIPRGAGFYSAVVVNCLVSIAGGATALAVASALEDWQKQAGPAIAEVHCRRTGPSKIELGYVAIGSEVLFVRR